jgi:hypothetical protein
MLSRFAFFIVITVFAMVSRTADGQCFNCYDDAGNMCLASCGVFAQTQYDNASSDPEGPYCCAGAIYPQCTSSCQGHGIGVDYSDYKGYPCYDNCYTVQHASVALMKEVVHGAPVYTTTCSGSLLAVDLISPPEPPKVVAERSVRTSLRLAEGGLR